MSNSSEPTRFAPARPSRLPHRVAAVLAVMVFPLIWLGGLVTTYDAGMAVPDWPGTYGYNMFLYPIETWLFGPFDLLVEHGHRQLASLSGLVAIGLVAVTFWKEPRAWVRWFSVVLLLLIILQGVLGGVRVLREDRLVAKIHGCVGPAFFASVVGFCVVTSRWWLQLDKHADKIKDAIASGTRLRLGWLAATLLIFCFGQLVLGALLRHIAVDARPGAYRGLVYLHVTVAILIVVGTLFQWLRSRRQVSHGLGVRASINFVSLLVVTQFSLGLATWVVKFGWPVWFADYEFAGSFIVGEKTFVQMNLITAHVAVGSLILAFWTIHALRCLRFESLARQSTRATGSTSRSPTIEPETSASSVAMLD